MSDATSKAGQAGTIRKTCKRCERKRRADAFSINKSYPDQLFPYCKDCQRVMDKDRRTKLQLFMKNKGEGELLAFAEYSKRFKVSPTKLRGMIENQEVDAFDAGTGVQRHWRIWVPAEPVRDFGTDPTEVATGNTSAGGPSLDLPVETLARLGGKIARLEGMADMLSTLVDGTENFNLEIQAFFSELKELIANGG